MMIDPASDPATLRPDPVVTRWGDWASGRCVRLSDGRIWHLPFLAHLGLIPPPSPWAGTMRVLTGGARWRESVDALGGWRSALWHDPGWGDPAVLDSYLALGAAMLRRNYRVTRQQAVRLLWTGFPAYDDAGRDAVVEALNHAINLESVVLLEAALAADPGDESGEATCPPD